MSSKIDQGGYLSFNGIFKKVKAAATTFTAKDEPGFGDIFRAANAWVTGDRRPYPRYTGAEPKIVSVENVMLLGPSLLQTSAKCQGTIRLDDVSFWFEPTNSRTTDKLSNFRPVEIYYANIRDLHMPVQMSASGPARLRIVLHTFHSFSLEIFDGELALDLFRALVTRAFPPDDQSLFWRWGSGHESRSSSESRTVNGGHDDSGARASLHSNSANIVESIAAITVSSAITAAVADVGGHNFESSTNFNGVKDDLRPKPSEDRREAKHGGGHPYQVIPPDDYLNTPIMEGPKALMSPLCLWKPPDIMADYKRMGFSEDNWRVTTINYGWRLCDTYPEQIYVPTRISDERLQSAAKHRARSRIPALCYYHRNSAVLLRCAQPLTGLKSARNQDDEALVECACKPTDFSTSKVFHIMDARPVLNALANMAGGKGYETWSDYGQYCRGRFLEIDNIHAMRNSLNYLIESVGNIQMGKSTISEVLSSHELESVVEKSKWLVHIKRLLTGATQIANAIESNESVLVHCSDGWDRTSQLTALAQVMLDPYYRTFDGMKVLIQKEWLSFGHKFQDRFGRTISKENEASPIFVQYLDCVFQLMKKYPEMFEFSPSYLIKLYEALVCGKYGTFLGNSEMMRFKYRLHETTLCMWTEVDEVLRSCSNASFSPKVQGDMKVLLFDSSCEPSLFAEMYCPFSYEK